MRAVVYCRVSTEGQERDGTSLETQEAQGRAHARAAGWDVITVVRETASGYTLDRPGLTRVREMMRSRAVDAVLAHAVDRLSRDQTHIGLLLYEAQDSGVRLEFVTERLEDTAEGRFLLAARAFIAEIERAKIQERTLRGKAARARAGKLPQGTGRGIYGYRYHPGTGRREVDPVQAAVVQRIFTRFCAGASVNGLTAELNREGILAFSGGAWFPLTVRRILQNETYTGLTLYRRTTVERLPHRKGKGGRPVRRVVVREEAEWIEVPDATPAIIDRGLWQRTQELLADPPHRARRGHPIYPYPLSGHVRCAACRTPLAGSALSGGPGRHRIRYYGCRNRNLPDRSARCPSRYVRADEIEARLVSALRRALADPAQIISAYNHLQSDAAHLHAAMGAIEAARQRVEEAQAQIRRLARLARLSDDEDVAATVAEELQLAVRTRKAAEAELARLEAERSAVQVIDADPATLAALSEQVAAWLEPADQEKMKLALEGLEITVWAGCGEPRATGALPVSATRGRNGYADVRSMVINRNVPSVSPSR